MVAVLVHLLGAVGPPGDRATGSDLSGETIEVAVATRHLAAGERITDADVARESRPARTLVGDPVTDPTGRRVTAPVLAGEPVVAERLAPSGLSSTAARVPAGGRAVAIPRALALPPLAPGDRVDVLVVGAGGFAAMPAARGAPVLAVDDTAVTVAVPATSAGAVTEGLAAGVVTLTLVGADP